MRVNGDSYSQVGLVLAMALGIAGASVLAGWLSGAYIVSLALGFTALTIAVCVVAARQDRARTTLHAKFARETEDVNTELKQLVLNMEQLLSSQSNDMSAKVGQLQSLLRDAIGKLVNCFTSLHGHIQSQQGSAERLINRTGSEMDADALSFDEFVAYISDTLTLFVDSSVETSHLSVQLVERMDEIRTKVDAILQTLVDIRGIAEQTNMLALNAAIEAARAGEAGRGFAVVADEVRALSNRSTGFAENIRQSVTDVNDALRGAESALQKLAARDMTVAMQSRQRITDMTKMLEADNRNMQAEAQNMSMVVQSVAHEVNAAVTALQFQDMSSQLLENIHQRLQVLGRLDIGDDFDMTERVASMAELRSMLAQLNTKFQPLLHSAVEQDSVSSGDVELF